MTIRIQPHCYRKGLTIVGRSWRLILPCIFIERTAA